MKYSLFFFFLQWWREHARWHFSGGFKFSQRDTSSGPVWRKPGTPVRKKYSVLIRVSDACPNFFFPNNFAKSSLKDVDTFIEISCIIDQFLHGWVVTKSDSFVCLMCCSSVWCQELTKQHWMLTLCPFVFRLYVRNFWSQEKRLPTATLERMLTVLRSLYSSQIERCFLSLATNLLLETTSQSPDFSRQMFEYPLSECTFQVSFPAASLPLVSSF